jgi:flagellar basal-body rod protein FlgB
MVDSMLYDRSVTLMGKALSISTERNRLISNNIANVDTVGYKPTDLNFKETFARALSSSSDALLTRTHESHFESGESSPGGTVYEKSDTASVDIDQEMTRLAENNLRYRTDSEMLVRKLNLIRYSITEGGK